MRMLSVGYLSWFVSEARFADGRSPSMMKASSQSVRDDVTCPVNRRPELFAKEVRGRGVVEEISFQRFWEGVRWPFPL
jgi:hypothetical protein